MGWWEVVSCGEVSGLLLVMSWIKKNSIEILNGFIQCIQPLRTMCLHRKKKKSASYFLCEAYFVHFREKNAVVSRVNQYLCDYFFQRKLIFHEKSG